METIARNGNYQDPLSNFCFCYAATCNLRHQSLHCVETMNLSPAELRSPYNKAHSVGPSSERLATSGAGTVKSPSGRASGKRKVPLWAGSPFSPCSGMLQLLRDIHRGTYPGLLDTSSASAVWKGWEMARKMRPNMKIYFDGYWVFSVVLVSHLMGI
jgi:hypothetical protein